MCTLLGLLLIAPLFTFKKRHSFSFPVFFYSHNPEFLNIYEILILIQTILFMVTLIVTYLANQEHQNIFR